jgi:uncharacterized membrane protein YphA (DoxX/SURF4 family)
LCVPPTPNTTDNKENKIKQYLKEIISSPYLTTIFRIIVGLVFIYASIDKISSPAYFAGTIQNYQIIPEFLMNIVAITLPWVELICGVLLLIGVWHRSAALILSLLMIVFIFAILSAIVRGLGIECGCFGAGTSANWTRIMEDIFLLAFSLQILFFPKSIFALENIAKKSYTQNPATQKPV